MDIREVADEINEMSKNYAVGNLQKIRETIHHHKSGCRQIFSSNPKTRTETWACHWGGRGEVQFNIGLETISGKHLFRYGLAFSLRTNQTIPSIDIFERRIQRCNEYIIHNRSALSDIEFWSETPQRRNEKITPLREIDRSLFQKNTFIFMGRFVPPPEYNPKHVLRLFDRLLPMYEYIETNVTLGEAISPSSAIPVFKPWRRNKPEQSFGETEARKFEIDLRHNYLQVKLCDLLDRIHGNQAIVTDEYRTSWGTRIDTVVVKNGALYFYEIKTASTIKECLRESIGQLLEYAYWPGTSTPEKMIVISENLPDTAALSYLDLLRQKFKLPIYHQQIDCDRMVLGTEH